MAYTNSSLISCTKLSPNYTSGRDYINRITIHHTATDAISCEKIGDIFANPGRNASCNYGIGNDGRICLIVEEKNRAWTSSNGTNDRKAITYEVSNSKYGEPWAISDKAMESVIALSVDICQRNGMKEVFNIRKEIANIPQSQRAAFANNYPVPEGKCLITEHNFFASTACPGTYLKGQMDNICAEINKRLGASPVPTPTPTVQIAKPTLYKGCRGNNTKLLQQNLMAVGIALPKYGADGDFGDETRSGVIAFQKMVFPNEPKEWDGIYGNKSYNKMNSLLNRKE